MAALQADASLPLVLATDTYTGGPAKETAVTLRWAVGMKGAGASLQFTSFMSISIRTHICMSHCPLPSPSVDALLFVSQE